MASAQISSLIRSSTGSSIVSIIVGSGGGGDKPGACDKKSIGEEEWNADVDEVANDNDDSIGEIGRKLTLISVEHEDVDEENDESGNTLKSMMDVDDIKHDIFNKLTSSGSSRFAKSSVK